MFKFSFLRKRSVIITWLLSYILMLAVPLVISGLTYIEAQNVIEREINQSNSFLLKRVQQRMDGLLKDISHLVEMVC